MGELRVRKRGKKWEWSFEGARIEGKRQPISKSGYRTKADAIAAGTQAKAEYDNAGRAFKISEVSVADYLDYWYENYVLQDLSYRTQLDYKRKIELHMKPALGKYRLASLEPDIIQKWINSKKDQGYSKSMVKNTLSCLSGALNYAVYPCKYIQNNPCMYVKIPKIKTDVEKKAHTEYICIPEDYQAILARFPKGSNFFLPIVTGYHCGTRIGETYAIDLLSDVDFENSILHIRHQLQKEHGVWVYQLPKYESVRSIKIDPYYLGLLKEELHNRKINMLKYGQYYTKTYLLPDGSIHQATADIQLPYREISPLSIRENGKLMTPESFKYCARIVHNELGNPLFHSHSLRHTHGTILAENGAQPKAVMERLGHKDLKTTMERYIFNTEKMQNNAVDIFVRATS